MTIVVVCLPCTAWGHGVVMNAKRGGCDTWVVEGQFTDGSPMAYAEVTIMDLAHDLPYQKGYSDKNGRFSFTPDSPGKWRVVFKDGLGHRAQLDVVVPPQGPGREIVNEPRPRGAGEMLAHQGLVGGGVFLRTLVGLLAIIGFYSMVKKVALRCFRA